MQAERPGLERMREEERDRRVAIDTQRYFKKQSPVYALKRPFQTRRQGHQVAQSAPLPLASHRHQRRRKHQAQLQELRARWPPEHRHGIRKVSENILLFYFFNVSLLAVFRADVEKHFLGFTGSNVRLNLEADYRIDGRILVLPITGSGKSNITMGERLKNVFLGLSNLKIASCSRHQV